jgi:spermidine/putrescine transport system permease protein
MTQRTIVKASALPLLTTLVVLAFFYLPLVVLVVNSFNESRFGGSWEGFTWKWYERLWGSTAVWEALRGSLAIAGVAALTSTVLGTLAALALHRYQTGLQRAHMAVLQVPLVAPDLLMGMSLLMFFVAVGMDLGFTTVCVAHVTFCTSYVALVILGRLQDFDFNLVDAARDLGASRLRAAGYVLLPLLWPGLLAGALLAFTLSMDDFVVTFFTSGPGTATLPKQIYSMVKTGRNLPVINALSTLMLAATFLVVLISRRLTSHALPR